MDSENKSLVRKFIEEIINTGSTKNINKFIDANYKDHNDIENETTGVQGVIKHITAVRITYPDLQVSIEHQIEEADFVVSRIIMRGTHSGEWLGMKPTHKQISINAVNIDRIKNNKIIEHWGIANSLEALIEIGAIDITI